MKYFKCMVILLMIVLVAGLGIYMCNDSKKAEKIEEAVLI